MGSGSVLDLQTLETLQMTETDNNNAHTLTVQAADGGTIDLRNLTSAAMVGGNSSDRLRFLVQGSVNGSSTIDHDVEREKPVAVKVLFPEFATTEEQKQRFVRAMKTMLPIRHENIVSLYGAGKQGPYCWAAMEFVDGESLDKVIQRIGTAGMLNWKETFNVAVHSGRALQAAFEHKIVHRNLTPTSLLRRSSDQVTKLADLMLAKATEGALARQVTSPGQLVGEVPYMSPERTRQEAEIDCRSDIYELGATLYALLTGRPPFDGDTLPQLVKRIREDEPEPPKKFHLAIPDQFQDVVMQMLEKRPANRYDSPSKLLVELTRVGKFQGLNAEAI